MMIKLGVLISGSGTNLQAIIDAIEEGELHAAIAIVIASRPDAYGLVRAREVGLPTASMTKEAYHDPLQADVAIAKMLKDARVDYVVMAGYMRKVCQPLLEAFPDRIINLHPALLPSFAGAHGIADAFDHGVKVTGITIHFANAVYDEGPIIAQRAINVEENDTLESLEERIHALEHALYPEVLQLIAEGRVSIDGARKVHIASERTNR
jgi:phosphoribosylglycinamide formyltransferase-1